MIRRRERSGEKEFRGEREERRMLMLARLAGWKVLRALRF